MPKYKEGQVLVPKDYCQGFEKITISDFDDKKYRCKIMNGIATIPIHVVEENYELLTLHNQKRR